MLKIRIASFFMKLGWIGAVFSTVFLVGTGVLFAVEKVIPVEAVRGTPWAPLPYIVAFFGGCFGAMYVIVTNRLGDVGYHIDRWVESHKPHLVKWQNNGLVAVVRAIDFKYEAYKEDGVLIGEKFYPRVPNTMTFSSRWNFKEDGKVTGDDDDLRRLEQGCGMIEWRPLFVPGTSGRPQEKHRVISLDEAYQLVHGRSRRSS